MKNTDRLFPPGSSVPMTAEARLREARELLLVIEPNSLHWPKSAVDDAVEAIERFTDRALEAARREARLEEAMLWLKATATAPLCGVSDEQLTDWKEQRIAALASRAAGEGHKCLSNSGK